MESFRQLRHLPRDLWIVCAGILVNRLGQMALPFLMLYLTKSRGMLASEASNVFVAYGLTAIVIAPIAGRLADRFGPTRIMCLSQFATALALASVPFLHSWPALIAGAAVWAACGEMFRPASMTAIGALAPPELHRPAFALARLAINLGVSVGALAGGWLSEVRFDLLFFVNASTCVAAAVVFVPIARRHTAAARRAKADGVSDAPLARGQHADYVRRLAMVCASSLCIALIFFQFDSTMPLFLTGDLGLPNSRFGQLIAVNTLLIVLVEVPLNAKVAHWPLSRTLPLSSLLVAAGFGSFAFAHGFLGAALGTVVWSFGEMLCFPAQNAFITALAPPGRTGRAMGWYLLTWNGAFSFGPALGTRVYENFGPGVLWGACFALGVVGSLIVRRAVIGDARRGAC